MTQNAQAVHAFMVMSMLDGYDQGHDSRRSNVEAAYDLAVGTYGYAKPVEGKAELVDDVIDTLMGK